MHFNNNINTLIIELGISSSDDTISQLNNIFNSPSSNYRTFNIPKRKGGFRKIDSPFPTLNYIQKLILERYLSSLKIHDMCFSYMKNKNAIGHAKHHLGEKELLTLDIKNFFPSISTKMVFDVLTVNKIDTSIAGYISTFCTLNDQLPQGASTSPALSNAVFYFLDVRLARLAESLNLKYSRYADDLAFSGEKIPRNLIKMIRGIIACKGFILNDGKTRLKLDGYKKIITGVSISNGVAKAPKSFKRALRAQIYELEKNKLDLFNMPNFEPSIYEKTLGKINYLLQIEPENTYALSKKDSLLRDFNILMMREIS